VSHGTLLWVLSLLTGCLCAGVLALAGLCVVDLLTWREKRRARREWESAHPGLSWDEWNSR
jgi:hypothetical protein